MLRSLKSSELLLSRGSSLPNDFCAFRSIRVALKNSFTCFKNIYFCEDFKVFLTEALIVIKWRDRLMTDDRDNWKVNIYRNNERSMPLPDSVFHSRWLE